jgi:hypothetical protein
MCVRISPEVSLIDHRKERRGTGIFWRFSMAMCASSGLWAVWGPQHGTGFQVGELACSRVARAVVRAGLRAGWCVGFGAGPRGGGVVGPVGGGAADSGSLPTAAPPVEAGARRSWASCSPCHARKASVFEGRCASAPTSPGPSAWVPRDGPSPAGRASSAPRCWDRRRWSRVRTRGSLAGLGCDSAANRVRTRETVHWSADERGADGVCSGGKRGRRVGHRRRAPASRARRRVVSETLMGCANDRVNTEPTSAEHLARREVPPSGGTRCRRPLLRRPMSPRPALPRTKPKLRVASHEAPRCLA